MDKIAMTKMVKPMTKHLFRIVFFFSISELMFLGLGLNRIDTLHHKRCRVFNLKSFVKRIN